MKFESIHALELEGLMIYERRAIKDKRGAFQRMYCHDTLRKLGVKKQITQINYSRTEFAGTVRGMHMQLQPHAETKIISCLKGTVYDVAVDLRRDSPTFLQHVGIYLSDKNESTVIIPEGFAHGFQAQTDECELLYLHTANYEPESETGFNAFDPTLAIEWPLPAKMVSEKDAKLQDIDSDFIGIEI